MEIALLDFRVAGKTLRKKERLNSWVSWFHVSLLSNFKIFVGIPSGWIFFLGMIDKKIFSISDLLALFTIGLMRKMRKELMPILQTNSRFVLEKKLYWELCATWNISKVLVESLSTFICIS